MIKECQNCLQPKRHHAKGLCYACYKKIRFNPPPKACKRCHRLSLIHAKDLCASCYNALFQAHKQKDYYARKSRAIDLKTFRKVTKSCKICGFDAVVDLTFLDKNKDNKALENLIGLCPNHHRMFNNAQFRPQILLDLAKKGIFAPEMLQK